VLPEVTISYRTLGTLAADRSNAVLITHGNTSGPQMIDPGGSTGEGSWNEIVGPGKAVDTNRFFAICPNMLGSSYGSTNGASIDPGTGKPYGQHFPDITVSDIVGTQRLLIDQLGIKKLFAIVGPSYGGFQAFQWAVNYPDMMKGIAPVVTSPLVPRERSEGNVARLLGALSKDPNWNGGDYYDRGGVVATMTDVLRKVMRDSP
jgi:homoserine O-acetyltransferase